MELLFTIYIAVIGAALGSFAGAMAWRIKKHRDAVRERSECEHCHHVLAVRDLIPVISWLWLRGRCRYCHHAIGWSSLVIEVVMAVAAATSFIVWPYGFDMVGIAIFVLWLCVLTGLAILFIYDLRHYLLPDVVITPLVVLSLGIFGLLQYQAQSSLPEAILQLVLAMLPVAGLYGALYAVSGGKWIGFGDVKLGVVMGLLLLWPGALVAVILANYLGFFWILPNMLRGKLDRSARIPFGPFLILATYATFVWGDQLISFVASLLVV